MFKPGLTDLLAGALFLACAFMMAGCVEENSPTAPGTNEIATFLVATHSDSYTNRTVAVTISSDRILFPEPEVNLGRAAPDSVGSQISQWHFRNMPADTVLSYGIIWGEDTLRGDISIPPVIDSLFIDERYVHDSYLESTSNSVYENPAAECKWTCRGDVEGYYVTYELQGTRHPVTDIFKMEPLLVLALEQVRDMVVYGRIRIYPTNTNPFADPPRIDSAGALYAHFDIRGPEYYARFTIEEPR